MKVALFEFGLGPPSCSVDADGQELLLPQEEVKELEIGLPFLRQMHTSACGSWAVWVVLREDRRVTRRFTCEIRGTRPKSEEASPF